jgi:hypothetical protein
MVFALLSMPLVHPESIANVDILHYELDITLVPQQREMYVSAKISLYNPGLNKIDFSLNDEMYVDEVRLDGKIVPYDHVGNTLSISLGGQGLHIITLSYRNSRAVILFGDIKVGRVGGPKETTFMVYRAAWYPIVFGDRATADIRITVPDGYIPITVGGIVGTTKVKSGKLFHWKTDIAVPGISFVVGDFVKKTAIVYITEEPKAVLNYGVPHGWHNSSIQIVEISCYFIPRHEALADSCISSSEKILKYYTPRFGGYPTSRLRVVEMPGDFFGGHGAMGLIMIHPSAFRGGSEELLAHEIAHNWWGALVSVKKGYNLQALGSLRLRMGMESWSNDLWLHEGMAAYSSILFLENSKGKNAARSSLRQMRSEYLKTGGEFSISSIKEDYSNGIYHATVYGKGALVIHMLRYVMGDEQFFRLLESYADKYAGTSVESEDFEVLAEEVYGADLSWFFDEWIRGSVLPDYTVRDAIVRWGNHRYYTTVVISQLGEPIKMPVDVTLATSGEKLKKRVMVEGEKAEVTFDSRYEPLYIELDEEGWLLEIDRRNNLYILTYPISPQGAVLIWREIWNTGILGALKNRFLP